MDMHNYPWDLELAESRGWDRDAHLFALSLEDEDLIALTHPTNWLTEDEVENVAQRAHDALMPAEDWERIERERTLYCVECFDPITRADIARHARMHMVGTDGLAARGTATWPPVL